MPTAIIGIGNLDRGDDGIGLWVAGRVARLGWPDVLPIQFESGDFTGLIAIWEGLEEVYVVDAVVAAEPVGAILRYPLRAGRPLALPPTFSTHGLGLAEAIELGRELDALPKRLVVYGIVGSQFGVGDPLSPAVESAGRRLIQRLRRLEGRRRVA